MSRGVSKYAPEDYAEMRRLFYVEKWSQGRIARKYDMSSVQIGRIVRGESQRSAPNPNPPLAESALAREAAASEERLRILLQQPTAGPSDLPEELKPKKPNPYI